MNLLVVWNVVILSEIPDFIRFVLKPELFWDVNVKTLTKEWNVFERLTVQEPDATFFFPDEETFLLVCAVN